MDDLREEANQLRQSAAQRADEITESGYTWERHDQWRTIHNQTVELQKDIRWLEQRLIDLVHWPIKNQREAPPRLLAPTSSWSTWRFIRLTHGDSTQI